MSRMHNSSLRTLLVFPALSLVVMAGCVSIDTTSTTSVQESPSLGENNSSGTGDEQHSNDSTITPKGSDTSGSDSSGVNPDVSRPPSSSTVNTNLTPATDPTTGVPGTVGPFDTQSQPTTPTSVLAMSVLERIRVENEMGAGYSRDLFRHWIDADGNRCNTREEVLIAESLTRAQVDAFGCTVVAGDWFSPFDGRAHTDPSDLDIDHLVPLKEAWDSGAHSWSSLQRERFANDLSDGRALIAVTSGVNRSKGDRDPSQWLPPRSAYVCTYVSDWIAVKYQWNLSMDSSEWGRLKNLLNGQCVGTTIAPWGSVSATRANPGLSDTQTSATSVPRSTTSTTIAKSVTTLPTAPSTAPGGGQQEDSSVLPTIRPGAYCTPEGGLGTYSSRVYICAKTRTTGEPYSDGRARWRQQ